MVCSMKYHAKSVLYVFSNWITCKRIVAWFTLFYTVNRFLALNTKKLNHNRILYVEHTHKSTLKTVDSVRQRIYWLYRSEFGLCIHLDDVFWWVNGVRARQSENDEATQCAALVRLTRIAELVNCLSASVASLVTMACVTERDGKCCKVTLW